MLVKFAIGKKFRNYRLLANHDHPFHREVKNFTRQQLQMPPIVELNMCPLPRYFIHSLIIRNVKLSEFVLKLIAIIGQPLDYTCELVLVMMVLR